MQAVKDNILPYNKLSIKIIILNDQSQPFKDTKRKR